MDSSKPLSSRISTTLERLRIGSRVVEAFCWADCKHLRGTKIGFLLMMGLCSFLLQFEKGKKKSLL
jgi:hypothetical protein